MMLYFHQLSTTRTDAGLTSDFMLAVRLKTGIWLLGLVDVMAAPSEVDEDETFTLSG